MNNKKELIDIIGDNIRYLYNIGTISFSDRVGIKNICRCFTNHPISKQDIKKLKKVFDELKLKSYKSGEYPVPPNLGQFKFLKYVKFNEDFTLFEVFVLDEHQTLNRVEALLYEEALDMYHKFCTENKNINTGGQ